MSAFFHFRHTTSSSTSAADILVVYVASSETTLEYVSAHIREQLESALSPDHIVIVCQRPLAMMMNKSEQTSASFATLAGRLNNRISLSALSFDAEGSEAIHDVLGGPSPPDNLTLNEIFRAGITHIARTRGAVLEATSTHHFRNPSGRHRAIFLKLSQALIRRAEVSFVAAALLSRLPGRIGHLHVDTPALFSVVGALNDLYQGLGARRRLSAESFGSYSALEDYDFLSEINSAVIISATSTGALGGQISKFGVPSERIVNLLYLGRGNAPVGAICDLRSSAANPEGYPEPSEVIINDECMLCAQGSIPRQVIGDQFDLATTEISPFLITVSHAGKDIRLIPDVFVGHRVLGVRTTSAQGLRLYRVGVRELLRTADFQARLSYTLSRLVPMSLTSVILLDGDGSAALGEEVIRIIGSGGTFKKFTAEEFENSARQSGQGAILVIAGAIDSGRSLRSLSLSLRLIAPEAPVIFLVGLSKASETDLERMRRSIIQSGHAMRHELVVIYNVPLPVGNFENSWAEELRLLRTLDADRPPTASEAEFSQRASLLERSSELLYDNLFWASASSGRLELTPGFAFWPQDMNVRDASQADVFFTVSSVLERARRMGASGGIISSSFEQSILSEENFMRYSDPVIQASILRAARPQELDYRELPDESVKMARLIVRIVSSPMTVRAGASREFLVALATKRLRLSKLDQDGVLAAVSNADPIAARLAEFLRAKDAA